MEDQWNFFSDQRISDREQSNNNGNGVSYDSSNLQIENRVVFRYIKSRRRNRRGGAGFKKGQSGNPRGWPPGAKNLAKLLNDALNEPVTVTENGRRRKITKREAVIKQLNNSASGDARSLKILLD